jgi:hypothetical protein
MNHISAKTVPNGTLFLSMSSVPIQANGKYPILNNLCPYVNSVIGTKFLIDLYPQFYLDSVVRYSMSLEVKP